MLLFIFVIYEIFEQTIAEFAQTVITGLLVFFESLLGCKERVFVCRNMLENSFIINKVSSIVKSKVGLCKNVGSISKLIVTVI